MQIDDIIFADSNIWLYSFINDEDSDKQRQARAVLRHANLVLSTQVVNEICRNLVRKGKWSEERITTLASSLYDNYVVIQFDKGITLEASRLRSRYSLSFWDGLIVAAALNAKATQLFSEDMQDGLIVNGTLRIINPFKE